MNLCLYAYYSPHIVGIRYVIYVCSRHIFIWLSMHYRVIARVLTPLIGYSHGKSLVFDSTIVHFNPKAFGKLPIDFLRVINGYLVEYPSSNRYSQPVKWYRSTSQKEHYLWILNFSNGAKFWNFILMNISLNISIRLLYGKQIYFKHL